MLRSLSTLCAPLALVACLAVPASATPLDIVVNFNGGLTASQQSIFATAETFWETQLVGYQVGISLSTVTIDAEGIAIDGSGGTLGQAGPRSLTSQGGFVLARTGQMQFDTADLTLLESSGRLLGTILHEMAHVLGFGTLWNLNGLYTDGTGQYTGGEALAAWVTEFNEFGATSVPVELGGGSGTRDGHWNENDGGGGSTGFVDAFGRDMRDELMTGWISGSTFVSQTTLGAFRDLGFLAPAMALPEPALGALWAILAFAFARRKPLGADSVGGRRRAIQ